MYDLTFKLVVTRPVRNSYCWESCETKHLSTLHGNQLKKFTSASCWLCRQWSSMFKAEEACLISNWSKGMNVNSISRIFDVYSSTVTNKTGFWVESLLQTYLPRFFKITTMVWLLLFWVFSVYGKDMSQQSLIRLILT